MSKQAIIIIVIIALIIIILIYSMWSKAQAAKLYAQQNYSYNTQKSQKVNVSDIGNFVGGLIGGIKVAKDQQQAQDMSKINATA